MYFSNIFYLDHSCLIASDEYIVLYIIFPYMLCHVCGDVSMLPTVALAAVFSSVSLCSGVLLGELLVAQLVKEGNFF